MKFVEYYYDLWVGLGMYKFFEVYGVFFMDFYLYILGYAGVC